MVKGESVAVGIVGFGAIFSSVLGAFLGIPAGVLGAQFWQITELITAGVGFVSIIILFVIGGVGVVFMEEHNKFRQRQRRRSLIYDFRRRERQKKEDIRFRQDMKKFME